MNHKLDTDERVYFYEQEFYVLSNFSAFEIMWKGILFNTSEHVYHWEKFAGMEPIQDAMLQSRSAHEAFKLAEKFYYFLPDDWNSRRVVVMKEILLTKVAQHEYVHRKLVESGDRELIEDSWRDDFWGTGPNGNGQNMLGKLWMEIRSELRGK